MSDDYKVQVSFKIGQHQGGMINVRGNTVAEVDQHIGEVRELLVPSVTGLEEELKAVGLIAAAFPGTTAVAQQATQPAQRPAQPGNGGAEVCQHGPMVWKTGADWQGWFCQARREDPTRCKARYQK